MNEKMTLEMSVQEFELDSSVVEIKVKRQLAEAEKRRAMIEGMRTRFSSVRASDLKVSKNNSVFPSSLRQKLSALNQVKKQLRGVRQANSMKIDITKLGLGKL